MGCLLMPLLVPATLDVSFSISRLTSIKSLNRLLGMWWNSAHSERRAAPGERYGSLNGSGAVSSSGMLMSCRISGRRVTMPLPRGRKSRPTMFSRTEDFPADWDPTTTWSSGALASSEDKGRQICTTHNLGEIEGIAANGVEHQVLQLVDRVEQIFAEGRHCSDLGSFFFPCRFFSSTRPGLSQSQRSIKRNNQVGRAAEMPPTKRFRLAQATRRLALGFSGDQEEKQAETMASRAVWQRIEYVPIRSRVKGGAG